VRFIVIGGVAVGAQGYIRGTEDLDLVLDSTLPTAGGEPFDPVNHAGTIKRGGNVTADTRFGGLDVVQRAQGVPSYSQLDADAVDSELLGVPVRVCSLARLRSMKEAQGRAQDRADLENLPEDSGD
jgi:hypothetical protein